MKKEIIGFVSIDKTPMTEKEQNLKLAQFAVLLAKWKQEDDTKNKKIDKKVIIFELITS